MEALTSWLDRIQHEPPRSSHWSSARSAPVCVITAPQTEYPKLFVVDINGDSHCVHLPLVSTASVS